MENFVLAKESESMPEIIGYDFHIDNPKAVICLVHGIGEYAGRYNRLAKYMGEDGIAVLSMDLPGHGLSKGKRGHTAPRDMVLDVVDRLISEAQKRYGDASIFVYGHSMGGNISLNHYFKGGLNDIPKGYIISAPWIRLVRNVSDFQARAIGFVARLMPAFTISSACPEEDLGNPIFVKPYKTNPLVHDRISLETAFDGYSIGRRIEDGRIMSSDAARAPMLLMHGTADPLCSIEGSKSFYKWFKGERDVEFVPWVGYLHEIHNGSGQLTGEEVIEYAKNYILEAIK